MASAQPLVLVTGASGYVASHVVHQLLTRGFRVRGTVRSLKNAEKVDPIRKLDQGGRLELVEADLLSEKGWDTAVAGCDFVQHLASPFPIVADETTITTAIAGTMNVLKAVAQCPTVKKVVMTSSTMAISEGHPEKTHFDESDHTNLEDKTVNYYSQSKALAEKEAWKFVNNLPASANPFKLTVINPTFVIGPPLIDVQGSSVSVIKKFLMNELPAIPRIQTPVVDVRDVALCHVEAMIRPESDGMRIIASADNSYWFKDFANILDKEFTPQGYTIPSFVAPNFIVKILSLWDKEASAIYPKLSLEVYYDNARAKSVLGVKFRPAEESFVAMGYALIERGIIKKAKNYKGVPPKYSDIFITGKPAATHL